jgi:hypothetical protein
MWPLVRYSPGRQAFVLRLVGNTAGPVLRRDNRRNQPPQLYKGSERREASLQQLIPHPVANSRADRRSLTKVG